GEAPLELGGPAHPGRVRHHHLLPVQEAEEGADGGGLAGDGPAGATLSGQVAAARAKRDAIRDDARPVAHAVEPVAERCDLRQVRAVRGACVRAALPPVPDVADELLDERGGAGAAHACTPTLRTSAGTEAISLSRIHAWKSATARSTSSSRRRRLSRGASVSGSSSPKFEFMGWKSRGSPSRR